MSYWTARADDLEHDEKVVLAEARRVLRAWASMQDDESSSSHACCTRSAQHTIGTSTEDYKSILRRLHKSLAPYSSNLDSINYSHDTSAGSHQQQETNLLSRNEPFHSQTQSSHIRAQRKKYTIPTTKDICKQFYSVEISVPHKKDATHLLERQEKISRQHEVSFTWNTGLCICCLTQL